MRIYSVESKNILFVNFLDFKIRVFSPRELLYSLIGIWMLIQAIQGEVFVAFGLIGLIIFIFGYIPYKFLPFEIQLINFLRFHFKNNSTSKKAKKEPASLLGFGESFVPENITDDDNNNNNDTIPEKQGPEIITIPNLDEPYTVTLKTSVKERFIPVSVYVDDIQIANTSTDRKGRVSCTILIDAYCTKRFCAKDDSDNVLYDQEIKFVP